ncbi:MAG: hypothetical protein WA323_18845 [Candidatus Nitrosopolaris sp.]
MKYTASAIAALVAVFCYQVAYGTNESSYNYGFKTATYASKCLAHPSFPGDDCSRSYISPDWGCSPDSEATSNVVTNQTACNDGFVTGFVHWCASDMQGCIGQVKEGAMQFNGTAYDQQAKHDHIIQPQR